MVSSNTSSNTSSNVTTTYTISRNISPPEKFQARNITESSVTLTWERIPSHKYRLMYSSLKIEPKWKAIDNISSGSFTIYSLIPGTYYLFKIQTLYKNLCSLFNFMKKSVKTKDSNMIIQRLQHEENRLKLSSNMLKLHSPKSTNSRAVKISWKVSITFSSFVN